MDEETEGMEGHGAAAGRCDLEGGVGLAGLGKDGGSVVNDGTRREGGAWGSQRCRELRHSI